MKNTITGSFTKRVPVPALMAAAIALAGTVAATPAARASDSDVARIVRGIEIAPVTLNLKGLDKDTVGLGSYLVSAVGQCNDCHTTPTFAAGGNPFDGQPLKVVKTAYLAGGVFFGGTLCSSNITPDKNGLPDGLTLANFLSAMQTGHDFRAKAKVLLQTMPWPYFRNMTTTDLTAIYEYLRAVPPNKTPKCPT
jgi:hypothetical protein